MESRDTEDDTWLHFADVVRTTYENMALRWQAEDQELARMKSPGCCRGVAGAMRGRTGGETANESDGGGACDAVTHPSLSIRPGFMDAKAAIRTESE